MTDGDEKTVFCYNLGEPGCGSGMPKNRPDGVSVGTGSGLRALGGREGHRGANGLM